MALTLSHYRFGIDELAESTHGWHAAEDTNPAQGVILVGVTFLLRFTVQADATGLSNVDNEFQYRKNGGTWTNITTSSTNVVAIAAAALTNGSNCTKRLSGTGTFESSAAGQTEDGTSGGTSNDIVASGNSETECGLRLVGADLADDDVIEFRLTRDGGTLLDTYAVVPTITVLKDMAGTLSSTLGAATLAATGTVDLVGTSAPTLGAVTASAAGVVEIAGVLGATLAAATLAATGTVGDPEILGTLATTLGPLTLGADAELDIAGTASSGLGELTLSATGEIDVIGQVSSTLAPVTLGATGVLDVGGQLDQTLGALSVLGTGQLDVVGSLSSTLGALVLVAQGVGDSVTGDLSATLGAVTLLGTGALEIVGSAATTLGALTLSAAGGDFVPSAGVVVRGTASSHRTPRGVAVLHGSRPGAGRAAGVTKRGRED